LRMNEKKYDRRRRIRSGALVLTIALAVSLLLGCGAVSDSKVPSGRTIGPSAAFDLTATPKRLLGETAIKNKTVMQSFAFDNVNHFIFIVQLMEGGQKLPGEPMALSGGARALNGDLCVTKLDFSGNVLGYMVLKGFGHGVQIGVEPGTGKNGEPADYLWTEVDAAHDHPGDGGNGWGTRLARFPFRDQAVLANDSPSLEKFQLIPGADRTTVSVDTVRHQLTMRYRLNGKFRFALFDLDQVKKQEKVKPLADVETPSELGGKTFQGYTSYNGYLYLLDGDAYGSPDSSPPEGNTYLTKVDFSTGKVEDRQRVAVAGELEYREPEGMAVQLADAKDPDSARLAFGFASGGAGDRKVNLYYIDKLEAPKQQPPR